MSNSRLVPQSEVEGKDETQQYISFESTAFDELQKDFQEVLQELVGDKSLEYFRLEYEKLHRALQQSHDSEKRLIKKCRDLNAEIFSNAAKVQTALKLSQEDQSTIAALKKEIERAWKMVEASHDKEQKAKETIQNLKVEISLLGRLVEQGAGLSINQESTVIDLLKQKDDLTKERDLLNESVEKLGGQNAELLDKVQQLEKVRSQGEVEIQSIKKILQTKENEAEYEQRRKERLDKELKELRQTLEQRHTEAKNKQTRIEQENQTISKQEQQLRDLKQLQESEVKQQQELSHKILEAEKKLEEQMNKNSTLADENRDRQAELRAKTEEINRLQSEKDKILKLHDALAIRARQLDDERKEFETQRNSLKAVVQSIGADMDSLKKLAERDKKQIDSLLRERDVLNKNVMLADSSTKAQIGLVKRHEKQAMNLEKDIKQYKQDAQDMKRKIFELEKQREKYGIDLSQSNAKYISCLEELNNKELILAENKKDINDLKIRLTQQKQFYEAVRSDRNIYSKNLLESQDKITEIKRKFKLMFHQVEQLKEEIKNKDEALVKENSEYYKVMKDNDKVNEDLDKTKKKMSSLQQLIENQKCELKELECIIQETEQEKKNQTKEYELINRERDLLGTQLTRRNEELAVLYEKIKTQQSALQRGEIQYKERVEEIRTLRRKIADLKRDIQTVKQQVAPIEELKREVCHSRNELLQEKTRVKALSVELETPMNVHRWRKLEGSDPAAYEMLQKIKDLQKRLNSKTEEVIEKDLLIQEKEKLYVELKNILARQPGPEVAEQLQVYQMSLKQKTKQLKAMTSELNLYEAQVHQYKDEIERLTREMQEIRHKHFEEKKKEQHQKEIERASPAANSNVKLASPGGVKSVSEKPPN